MRALFTEQSRRDDLESLGFVLLYFTHRGQLPWQNLRQLKVDEQFHFKSSGEQYVHVFNILPVCLLI